MLLAAATTSALGARTQSPIASNSPSSPAELAAGVTPIHLNYPPGHFRRYGAVGDGKADDTPALNRAIAVLNAGHPYIAGEPGDVYMCAPLDAIKADNARIDGCGATLKVRADSWQNVPDGSTHLNVVGSGVRVTHLTFDGNQGAFTHAPRGRLLQFGRGALLLDVVVRNSPAQGARSGGHDGVFIACHFDDNANLGMELASASYLKFIGCSWNRNGYGFQRNAEQNTFAAFGLAARFRCHHLLFQGCDALQNGRDGFAVGQGSYACRFSECTAWMNGDGGFTIHADRTAAGASGDGESCYDLEYVDCESYDNFGSGLVSFVAAFNVTVTGGRYYNNHRLAGSLPFESSYPNGIYFAAGSRGITIATKAYDDRQLCQITGVAAGGGKIQAQGWVAGTRANYPKVAFYSPDGKFKGYATITAESQGSVSVETLAHDGVDLSRIAAGWQITQRVQHNGCFLDNDCQGSLEIDGFGLLPGPTQYTGSKSLSGYFSNGQNVRLPAALIDDNELVLNPGFEVDLRNWSFTTPGGGSAARHTGPKRRSAASLELKAGTEGPSQADPGLDKDLLYAAGGTFVQANAWCYADASEGGGLQLFWNPSQTEFHSTVGHPGGGWRCLAISAFIPAGATRLALRLYSSKGKTCYFDNISLRTLSEPTDGRDITYPGRDLDQ
jgi:hypothetical protein